jgi:hypothetical protein
VNLPTHLASTVALRPSSCFMDSTPSPPLRWQVSTQPRSPNTNFVPRVLPYSVSSIVDLGMYYFPIFVVSSIY